MTTAIATQETFTEISWEEYFSAAVALAKYDENDTSSGRRMVYFAAFKMANGCETREQFIKAVKNLRKDFGKISVMLNALVEIMETTPQTTEVYTRSADLSGKHPHQEELLSAQKSYTRFPVSPLAS
jgi:hypothetical protein